jgi:putative hemolysin
MLAEAFGWFILNALSIIIMAFYAMQELAVISFNKIRLQYYTNKGMKQAQWLNYLLQKPIRLFATTLICVNTTLFIGSECARQTFIALNLNPDLAVFPQVILVLLFGELTPMSAARRHAEHVALLGAPLLYFSAKVLTPVIWAIQAISGIIDYFLGPKTADKHGLLNQDDLQKILDEQDEEVIEGKTEEVGTIAKNIFGLRNKDAEQIMDPIEEIPLFPANGTVEQLRSFLLKKQGVSYLPIYHKDATHIVGIVNPRNYIRVADTKRVREHAEAPWFITKKTKVMQILKEFRRNNKNVAIVLDEQGLAVGMITLETLTEELFGKIAEGGQETISPFVIIDRTLPGEMRIADFNAQFDVILTREELTLAELMENRLGHHPEIGESIYIAPFELTVKETSFTEIKLISVKTKR